MKITAIHVWALTLPLNKPYWLSGGRLKFSELDSTFVRIDAEDGDRRISGFGEACPWGNSYLPAHAAGVRAGVQTLAPALLGMNALAPENINRRMDETLPGHPYAKAALDIACWDILGKFTNMPLWQCLGGASAAAVALNSSISTNAPQTMIEDIQHASAAGYRIHSAKIGGSDAATDIARINAIEPVRQQLGEKVTYDINRAWTPSVAVEVLNSVAARGWIEQPCETLAQCAQVAARVPQPIMLDECLHTAADFYEAHRLNAGEGCKLKPNRVGGITKARFLRDYAISIGWCMHIEDVGGSAFADTVAIHLAASTPETQRLASWLCHAHLAVDPVFGQGARNRPDNLGYAIPPSTPGVGVVPDETQLGTPVASYRSASP